MAPPGFTCPRARSLTVFPPLPSTTCCRFKYIVDNFPDVVKRNGLSQGAQDMEEDLEDGECSVVVKHMDSEDDMYLNEELAIASLFQHVASSVAYDRPKDPLKHMINQLTYIQRQQRSADEEDMEEDEEDEEPVPDNGPSTPPPDSAKMKMRGRRASVSAECMQVRDKHAEEVQLKVVPKSEAAKAEIKNAVKDNILFKGLDDTLRGYIVDAVFEVSHKVGDAIIKQGDEGDNFYIVSKGECDIYLAKSGQDYPGQHISTCGPGKSFGELALMYNSPRAATIIAKTECVLWALDRQTFRQVMLDTTSKKRKLHEQFLQNVPVLGGLTDQERSKVADVLDAHNFKEGDMIITQGEPGDRFYILEAGSASAVVTKGGEQVRLKDYGKGDFFGELALITDKPRAAGIVATSPCICVSMDRGSFKRLLGPLEDTMRGNIDVYDKIMKQMMGA